MKYTITYQGKGYGLNDAYSKNHWTRRKIKEEFKAVFFALIDANPTTESFPRFKLKLLFNARFDCSNNAALEKVFTDCLRYRNIIDDDNNKVLYKVTFQKTDKLPTNTFQFTLTKKG